MNDKLNDALNQISDKHLAEAENIQKAPHRRPYWIAAVAAVLAVVIGITAASGGFLPKPEPSVPTHLGSAPDVPDPTGIQSPNTLQLRNLVASPQYPEMAQRPSENGMDYKEYSALLDTWKTSQSAQYDQPQDYADSLTDFFTQSIPLFLNTEENSAYSPVNVYMALAMLAETAGGNSQQQILDVLGLESIEELREQVGHVWNAHYQDDGVTTLLLGNSLWLDSAFPYRQDTTQLLAENYYTSSFHGDLGTEEMDRQLQQWLNANTGGLLQEQAENIKLDPATVFALASTIYFSSDWESEFSPKFTQDMPFHCGEYDLMTPFMRQTLHFGTYYRGSNFGAVALKMSGENSMWLILPDEGYSVSDILESDEYLHLTMTGRCERRGLYQIYLSMPKFDVASETNLVDGLQRMGITDVFDPFVADFTSISDMPGLAVGSATHAARVTVDEEGCLAAAFTVFATYGTSASNPPPELDFTLDRPFLFVISSRDDLPLFAGTVVEP